MTLPVGPLLPNPNATATAVNMQVVVDVSKVGRG